MVFTPKTLDGLAAGAAFMKLTGIRRGTCLNAVWRAFGSPKSDGLNNGYPWASDALKGARASGALRTGSIADAPPGSVLYWSNVMGTWNRNGRKVYGDAGHVGIKGHGGFWTIDATGHGSLDFVANDRLAKKWPWVRFEGYAYGPGAFLGHTVTAVTASTHTANPFDNTPPSSPQETDMKHIYHPERGHALVWSEGAYGYPDIDIDAIVAKGIEPSIKYDHAWQWDTEVREANIRGSAMRDLQTAHTLKALQAAGVQVNVDETAIAKATAALLPDVGAIVAEIVKALPAGATAAQIAAELSKRLAS